MLVGPAPTQLLHNMNKAHDIGRSKGARRWFADLRLEGGRGKSHVAVNGCAC